jgi:hypothetical protein
MIFGERIYNGSGLAAPVFLLISLFQHFCYSQFKLFHFHIYFLADYDFRDGRNFGRHGNGNKYHQTRHAFTARPRSGYGMALAATSAVILRKYKK